MNKINIVIDRKSPSSKEIKDRQNFNKILKNYKNQKVDLLKKPLFYGILGIASLLLFISFM